MIMYTCIIIKKLKCIINKCICICNNLFLILIIILINIITMYSCKDDILHKTVYPGNVKKKVVLCQGNKIVI